MSSTTGTDSSTDTTTDHAALDVRAESDELADFVANARTVVDEARLHFDADGLSMKAVSADTVTMIEQTPDAVGVIECHTPDGGLTVGMNLERLADVVDMIDGEVRLRMGEDRKLVVTGDGLRFEIAAIDPKSIRSEPSLPDVDQPAAVKLDATQYDRALRAASLVSNHLTIGAKAGLGACYVEAEGDTDNARDALEGDDLNPGSSITTDCESIFSVELHEAIASAPGIDGEVTLHFGTEVPMTIEAEGLTFVVAPRVGSK